MKETITKIKVGDLVTQKGTGHLTDQKLLTHKDQTGVILRLYETTGPLAMWSPLTAEILWSSGEVSDGFLVTALEVITEE
jgi:hypothetical protein|tara:strand:- start:2628 stop:2867 length:240 start_codon:yes stop_codon:yes gene_type:complete